MDLAKAFQVITDLVKSLDQITPEQKEALNQLEDFAVNQLADD